MIKKLKMKNLNLLFAAALILLMYRTPSFLTDIATSAVGRTALVIILAYVLIYCEFSCAIFFALIVIVLFHNTIEGFKEGKGGLVAQLTKKNPEEDPEDEDKEKEDTEEEEEDTKDDEEEEEEEEEDERKEGFLGFNMISKKVMNKNFLGDLRNTMKHNLTDFDRFLKTNSEEATIASTKQ